MHTGINEQELVGQHDRPQIHLEGTKDFKQCLFLGVFVSLFGEGCLLRGEGGEMCLPQLCTFDFSLSLGALSKITAITRLGGKKRKGAGYISTQSQTVF